MQGLHELYLVVPVCNRHHSFRNPITKRKRMSYVKAALGFLIIGSAIAHAQNTERPPTYPTEAHCQPTNTCIYASQVYTLGSRLNGMICGKPDTEQVYPPPTPVWLADKPDNQPHDGVSHPDTTIGK